MILAIDSSALALLVNPAANPPNDPATGMQLAHARERVEYLIASMTAADTLIIPTPVLAEALVRAEDGGPGLLEALAGLARVKVRPFGERAAVETAMMTREAIQAGDKRSGSEAPWQKVKVDRQVIAVARVEGATSIYADDKDLVAFAKRLGLDAYSTWDLPMPPQLDNLFTAAGVSMVPESPASDPITSGDADTGYHEVEHDAALGDAILTDLAVDGQNPEQANSEMPPQSATDA